MNLFPAQTFDIDSIMKIERQAFIPQIQEKKSTFEKRLIAFPNGFFILSDASEKVVMQNKGALTCGYLCSEIWDAFPTSQDSDDVFLRRFALGHDIKSTHNENGCYLYISSFALLRDYQGKGLGRKFFENSLVALCSSFPNVKSVVLLVNSEWLAAVKIYKSFGFKETRILKNFFPTLGNRKFDLFSKNVYSDGIVMTCDADVFRKSDNQTEPDNIWQSVQI